LSRLRRRLGLAFWWAAINWDIPVVAAEGPCAAISAKALHSLPPSVPHEMLHEIARRLNLEVVPLEVAAPPSSIRDREFGDVNWDETAIRYEDLPANARGADLADPLYFGRPEASLENALRSAQTLFQFGRNNRGAAHRDVFKHVASTQTGSSGFLQTSKSYEVAVSFAKGDYGVVLIVNPKGAKLLDLEFFADAFPPSFINAKVMAAKSTLQREKEVLFSGSMPPQRIVGAVILKKNPADRTVSVIRVYENPNYASP
jgi:hypothetical protein